MFMVASELQAQEVRSDLEANKWREILSHLIQVKPVSIVEGKVDNDAFKITHTYSGVLAVGHRLEFSERGTPRLLTFRH